MTGADHAGFFAYGIAPEDFDLPHPRIALPVILIVRRVLVRAFDCLRERGFPLATAGEDEITVGLHNVIENELRRRSSTVGTDGVPGFTFALFEAVSRHQSVTNYSGVKLKKEPDLCFKLRVDDEARVVATQFGLFIECKPVDAAHPAGSAYIDDGLQRFIDGDYAWAMQDAMMVGYVRDGRTIGTHLIPAMLTRGRPARLSTVAAARPVGCPGAEAIQGADALHRSTHRRNFEWLCGKGPATELVIYHTWHDASGS